MLKSDSKQLWMRELVMLLRRIDYEIETGARVAATVTCRKLGKTLSSNFGGASFKR